MASKPRAAKSFVSVQNVCNSLIFLKWHGRGREFESHQVHQMPQRLTKTERAKCVFWSPNGVQKWTPATSSRARMGIPGKPNAESGMIPNSDPDEPEHHRIVATLAPSIVPEVFGFGKENLSGAQRRKSAWRRKGCGERQPLSPPQHAVAPEREERSRTQSDFQLAGNPRQTAATGAHGVIEWSTWITSASADVRCRRHSGFYRHTRIARSI